MKNVFFLFILTIAGLLSIAQVPQSLNYQAVARNSSGNILANRSISARFSIRDGSPTAGIVYQETDSATTNQFGLFTTLIGNGSVTQGSFVAINWATGNKYLEVELDSSGGNSYVEMGTTQLVSVPYAFNALNSGYAQTSAYAQFSDSAGGGGSGSSGFTHYLGELFGGGVVFHVYQDSTGQTHGLIAALTDLVSDTVSWSNVNSTIGPSAQSAWNGKGNSDAIIAQPGQTISAAKVCEAYNGGGYNDWYFPAIDEMAILFVNRFNVDKTLSAVGAAPLSFDAYMSSTEGPVGGMDYFYYYPNVGGDKQEAGLLMRPVRAF